MSHHKGHLGFAESTAGRLLCCIPTSHPRCPSCPLMPAHNHKTQSLFCCKPNTVCVFAFLLNSPPKGTLGVHRCHVAAHTYSITCGSAAQLCLPGHPLLPRKLCVRSLHRPARELCSCSSSPCRPRTTSQQD